jgi:nucleoside phosphorylase
MPPSLICLVVALPAEARPIVSRFGLRRLQPDRTFPVYAADPVSLVVSGPGKVNAAAATMFLHAAGGDPANAAWVNIGVAGHADREVGEPVLAREITDAGTGQRWHPTLPRALPCPADTLVTLDRAVPDYGPTGLVDMEASGFIATASRFAADGRTQVLKVVSDNRRRPATGVSAKLVRRLVADSLDVIESLLAQLGADFEHLR